ncbi:hypothetical protein RHGRI_030673 [Rhododendron griersonianum]|uniref:Casein kinase II subunit beta n=1 Tax=Rhododendron griersonianum TaxID=479676 RepID=A0AAV6I8T2_9ERIC|nr:hypothetical protein RHGRI_030673 [Rhododendron griersonianum]
MEESETDSEESDVSGSEGDDTSWIAWFCNLRGNEFFCEVDDDYIQDDFNLCGLSSQVPYYDYALDLILDVESSHGDTFTEEQNELVESAAEMLYGLIHVRYILTSKGMAAMLEKYKNAEFGRCPRVYCSGQPCLPVGQSDIPRQNPQAMMLEFLAAVGPPDWGGGSTFHRLYVGDSLPVLGVSHCGQWHFDLAIQIL